MPQWARAAGARCSAVSTVPCTFCRTQIVHQRWEIRHYFHHLLPWGFPETWNLEQTCPSILIGFCWGMRVVFSSSSLKSSQYHLKPTPITLLSGGVFLRCCPTSLLVTLSSPKLHRSFPLSKLPTVIILALCLIILSFKPFMNGRQLRQGRFPRLVQTSDWRFPHTIILTILLTCLVILYKYEDVAQNILR